MPIAWRINGRRIDVVFSDPYTLQESEKSMKEIFAEPALTRPLRFLVDVRHSAAPDVEFVGNAITFWQLHVDKMWGAKVAVLTSTAGQSRMADFSGASAESRDLPFTVRGFPESEFDEAVRWLERTD
jgi:SpoIIAA-like